MTTRKKIFVNASTVLISGGLILTQNILDVLIKLNRYELIIICPSKKKYTTFITSYSYVKVIPKVLLKRIFRPFLDYIWIPTLIHITKPHLVLSLGNLPTITKYPQIYLHDNPYLTEQQFNEFSLSYCTRLIHNLRKKETLSRMKYVNHILVQTDYQKTRLSKLIGDSPITVIPPSIPLFSSENIETPFNRKLSNNRFKILCLSRYYEHKNIEKLIEVSSLIRDKNLPFTIYITISDKHHKKAKQLLNAIKANNVNEILINLGPIPHNMVSSLLSKSDVVLIPSFMESFSLVFIEAWKYNKPLFVSDLASIKSSCGEGAQYFDPSSSLSILNCLRNAFGDRKKLENMCEKGKEQLTKLPEWSAYAKIIDKVLYENSINIIS